MGGKRGDRLDAVDGMLLLNKPAGMTSNRALQKVRRLLNARKAGHTGSLDPSATGMLPLCFGEATKVCPFMLNADKTYRVTAQLGVATDTGDADGQPSERRSVPQLDATEWARILSGFEGESVQMPPMYSALRKGGKRLYELARQGLIVEREERPIRIDAIDLLELAGSRLVFRVRCSKGTYVRTLVEDIARAAGTVAHTARLHRESVADFRADDMLDLAVAKALVEQSGPIALRDRLLPPDRALGGLPKVALDDEAKRKFTSGQPVSGSGRKATGLVRVYGDDAEFLGVGQLAASGSLAPRRIFKGSEKIP